MDSEKYLNRPLRRPLHHVGYADEIVWQWHRLRRTLAQRWLRAAMRVFNWLYP